MSLWDFLTHPQLKLRNFVYFTLWIHPIHSISTLLYKLSMALLKYCLSQMED